jgi:transposase
MEAIRKAVIEHHQSGMTRKDIATSLKIHRSTVYRIIDKFKATGTIKRLSGQGRPRTVRTPAAIRAVRDRIRRNPVRSMRKVAKDLDISERTIRRIVKVNLGAKSRARIAKQLISSDAKTKRLERAKKLLSRLKRGAQITLFSDEKVFTIDQASSSRSDRYISQLPVPEVPDNIKHVSKTKHPASVMVFGLVSSDGKKMPLVFIPNGIKINTEEYIRILKDHVKPWIEANYDLQNTKIVFQQDGAPAHTSKRTQEWLKNNLPDYWGKDLWPPNSPDLNPLDYSIWWHVESRACRKPHSNITALKSSINKEWTAMDPEYIQTTCAGFRRRIEAVIKAGGGYFE